MTGTDTLTACLGSVAPCGGAPGGPRPLTFYYPANEPPGPSLGLALASVRSRHGEGVCRSELSSVSGPRWTYTAAPSVIGLLFGSLRSRACAHGRLLFLNTMPTWSKVQGCKCSDRTCRCCSGMTEVQTLAHYRVDVLKGQCPDFK